MHEHAHERMNARAAMEPLFWRLYDGAALAWSPPMPYSQPHQAGGPGGAITHGGPEPQCGSSPSWRSGTMGWLQTNRGGIGAPSDPFLSPGNHEMPASQPGSASALPDDVAGAWAHICAQF